MSMRHKWLFSLMWQNEKLQFLTSPHDVVHSCIMFNAFKIFIIGEELGLFQDPVILSCFLNGKENKFQNSTVLRFILLWMFCVYLVINKRLLLYIHYILLTLFNQRALTLFCHTTRTVVYLIERKYLCYSLKFDVFLGLFKVETNLCINMFVLCSD